MRFGADETDADVIRTIEIRSTMSSERFLVTLTLEGTEMTFADAGSFADVNGFDRSLLV